MYFLISEIPFILYCFSVILLTVPAYFIANNFSSCCLSITFTTIIQDFGIFIKLFDLSGDINRKFVFSFVLTMVYRKIPINFILFACYLVRFVFLASPRQKERIHYSNVSSCGFSKSLVMVYYVKCNSALI